MVKLRQYIADHKVGIFIIVIVLVLVSLAFAFSVRRYGWGWTGFCQDITQTSTTADITTEIHPRTFWDVLELAIIPASIALIVVWLNREQRQRELEIAEKERDTERQIAKDREEERALQGYLEAMTELLLEKKLRTPEEGSEVRSIARARTLTILRSLSSERKGSILRFLYEAKLIDRKKTVIALRGAALGEANLRGANLGEASLRRADLYKANLGEASLRRADLYKANLGGANLGGANLGGAFLGGANLGGANLYKADLEDASLWEANLGGANLRGANLRGADLVGAFLGRAFLVGADLVGAHLGGADLEGACLERAELSEDSILPDGTKWTLGTEMARFTDPDDPDFWQP